MTPDNLISQCPAFPAFSLLEVTVLCIDVLQQGRNVAPRCSKKPPKWMLGNRGSPRIDFPLGKYKIHNILQQIQTYYNTLYQQNGVRYAQASYCHLLPVFATSWKLEPYVGPLGTSQIGFMPVKHTVAKRTLPKLALLMWVLKTWRK